LPHSATASKTQQQQSNEHEVSSSSPNKQIITMHTIPGTGTPRLWTFQHSTAIERNMPKWLNTL